MTGRTAPRTSLSAGAAVYEMLEPLAKAGTVTKIIPVATDKAVLPYIVYRRTKAAVIPQKSAGSSPETLLYEVDCYSSTYDGSVAVAEAVRELIDCVSGDTEFFRIRSCCLVDSSESYDYDAYCQTLVFEIKIY